MPTAISQNVIVLSQSSSQLAIWHSRNFHMNDFSFSILRAAR